MYTRKFRAIVLQTLPPEDKNVIWVKEGLLYYWGNTGWEPLGTLVIVPPLQEVTKPEEPVQPSINVVLTTGISKTNVMSQKATTDAINSVASSVTGLQQYINYLQDNIPSKEELNEISQRIDSLDIPSLDGLVTEEYVQLAIEPFITLDDLNNYATQQYVDDSIDSIDIPSIEGLATKTYVDLKILQVNSGTPVNLPFIVEDTDTADIIIADLNGTPIATFKDGHIKTALFNSASISSSSSGLSLKLLALGNSHTVDCLSYLPIVMENLLPGISVTIGIAFYAGCSLQLHYSFASSNSAEYDYFTYKPEVGKWQLISGKKTLLECILMERWDLITFLQQSSNSRDYSTFLPYLDNLITYVLGKVTWPVRLGWLFTFAYPNGYYALADGSHNDTSDSMYEKLAAAVQRVLLDTPIDLVLPCGTAIQNARHTPLNSIGSYGGLTAEGLHLNEGIAPLITAYAAAITLMLSLGSIRGILSDTTRPTDSWISQYNIPLTNGTSAGVTTANIRIAQKCAIAANKNKFNITQV